MLGNEPQMELDVLGVVEDREKFKCGPQEWRDFMASPIWHDMKYYLECHHVYLRTCLELQEIESGKEVEVIAGLRGECALLRMMKDLPDAMIDALGEPPADAPIEDEESSDER